jgi:hypothetical protein
MIEIA